MSKHEMNDRQKKTMETVTSMTEVMRHAGLGYLRARGHRGVDLPDAEVENHLLLCAAQSIYEGCLTECFPDAQAEIHDELKRITLFWTDIRRRAERS